MLDGQEVHMYTIFYSDPSPIKLVIFFHMWYTQKATLILMGTVVENDDCMLRCLSIAIGSIAIL